MITKLQDTNADTLYKTGNLVRYNMDGSRYNFGKINYGLERVLITDLCPEAFILSESM